MTPPQRQATAPALTSAGKRELTYTIEWIDKSRGESYVVAQGLK
jgi:hypothetical protein